jgi:hypothetical protein
MPTPRTRRLPARGTLLVSTDLHGNLEDFDALEALFTGALKQGQDAHWALLGDLVHGPSEDVAASDPDLYGYPDQSAALVARVAALVQAHPGRVHLVLGNHDHGHIGGRRTSKFHDDEVAFLEAQLTPQASAAMHALFESAVLALVAPCGALLSHGSPGDEVTSLALLDGTLQPPEDDRARWRALQSILWSYGQRREATDALLQRVSAEVGFPVRFVIHGHDRDEKGWFTEGDNQAQPVVFGALREHKRHLWLDLGATYRSLQDLREGHEVRRLYEAD